MAEFHRLSLQPHSDRASKSAAGIEARETPIAQAAASLAGNQEIQRAVRTGSTLTVSQPGDADEREADAAAAMFSSGNLRVQRKCSGCASEKDEELRRKAGGEGKGKRSTDPSLQKSGLTDNGGRALPVAVQRDYERFFDADLSGVRVHTDSSAQHAAAALDAHAFTHKRDIYFARDRFDPNSPSGRQLLAHELTHVAQQGSNGLIRRAPDDPPAFTARAANPGPNYYFFRGVRMSTSPVAMHVELRNHVRFHGIQGLDLWYQALQGRGLDVDLPFSAYARASGGLRVRSVLDVKREDENNAWRNRLAPVAVPLASSLYPVVRKEAVDLLANFEKTMGTDLELVLGESEKRINAERIRYDIKDTGGILSTSFTAQKTEDFQALVGAARDLLAIRNRISQLEAEKKRALVVSAIDPFRTATTSISKDKLDQIDARLAPLEEEYKHAKAAASLRHPALGAVLDESSLQQSETRRLQIVATGRTDSSILLDPIAGPIPTGTSAILGHVFAERQASIDKVRSIVAKHPDKLWSIGPIIELTRSVMAGEPTGMLRGIVDEKIRQREFDEALWRSFLIVPALLLAIPTGGSSLAATGVAAASLTLSAYQALESIRKYQFDMALANTDLDRRAYALAAEEPSAFWVALDVAFVFLDAHQAVGAFRAVKNEARASLRAAEGAESLAADRKLFEAADKFEGGAKSRLGERLRASLARLRRQGKVERELGGVGKLEAEAVERAARTVVQEAKSAEGIAVVAGHELKVTRSGHIVLCTECTWLRSFYVTELAEKPVLLERLESAERKAAAGALDVASKSDLKMLTVELEQARKLRLTPGAATGLPKDLEEAAALAPKAPSKNAPIASGESAHYAETTTKGRGVSGDRLTGDHIPSRAALVEAKQNALWDAEAARLERPLTPAEKDALLLTDAEKAQINREGLALVKGEQFHVEVSRTWGPRNRAEQIALDAADLSQAVHSDFLTDLRNIEAGGGLTRSKVAEYIQHYQNLVSHGVIAYSESTNNLLLDFLKRAKP